MEFKLSDENFPVLDTTVQFDLTLLVTTCQNFLGSSRTILILSILISKPTISMRQTIFFHRRQGQIILNKQFTFSKEINVDE